MKKVDYKHLLYIYNGRLMGRFNFILTSHQQHNTLNPFQNPNFTLKQKTKTKNELNLFCGCLRSRGDHGVVLYETRYFCYIFDTIFAQNALNFLC